MGKGKGGPTFFHVRGETKNFAHALWGQGRKNDSSLTNTQNECGDKSDERAELCTQWNCTSTHWKCNNNKCINAKYVCDGKDHCRDNSDENVEHCLEWNCTAAGRWACSDNITCVSPVRRCDGTNWKGCPDASDELDCFHGDERVSCQDGWWRCKDGKTCIKVRHQHCKNYRVVPNRYIYGGLFK